MSDRILRLLCVVLPVLLTALSDAVTPVVLSADAYKVNSFPQFLHADHQLLVVWTQRLNVWEKEGQLACIRVTDKQAVADIAIESLLPPGQRIACWVADDVHQSSGKLLYASDAPVSFATEGQRGKDYHIAAWQYDNAQKKLLINTGEIADHGNAGDSPQGNILNPQQSFFRPMLIVQDQHYFCVATSYTGSAVQFSIFDRELEQGTAWNLTGCHGTFPAIVPLQHNNLLVLYTEARVSGAYRYHWYDEVGLAVPDQDNWPLSGQILATGSDDHGATWSKPTPRCAPGQRYARCRWEDMGADRRQ